MQLCKKINIKAADVSTKLSARCRFVAKNYMKDFGWQVAAGESQPCKAVVDNGRETSPEIVSQNTF